MPLSAIARLRRGRRNQLQPSFPRSPGIIPVALSTGFFMPAAPRLFHQRTGENVLRLPAKSRLCFSQFVHTLGR
jgi:hypothetical protein